MDSGLALGVSLGSRGRTDGERSIESAILVIARRCRPRNNPGAGCADLPGCLARLAV